MFGLYIIMAISAFALLYYFVNQEDEKMTRLIDADELKKAITRATYNFEQIPIRVDEVQDIIDKAPTVTPDMAQVLAYENGKENVTKKGEWIEKLFGKTLCRFSYYECSICGVANGEKTNHCPSCGARMEADNGTDN